MTKNEKQMNLIDFVQLIPKYTNNQDAKYFLKDAMQIYNTKPEDFVGIWIVVNNELNKYELRVDNKCFNFKNEVQKRQMLRVSQLTLEDRVLMYHLEDSIQDRTWIWNETEDQMQLSVVLKNGITDRNSKLKIIRFIVNSISEQFYGRTLQKYFQSNDLSILSSDFKSIQDFCKNINFALEQFK